LKPFGSGLERFKEITKSVKTPGPGYYTADLENQPQPRNNRPSSFVKPATNLKSAPSIPSKSTLAIGTKKQD
jgi:hypothetical protein